MTSIQPKQPQKNLVPIPPASTPASPQAAKPAVANPPAAANSAAAPAVTFTNAEKGDRLFQDGPASAAPDQRDDAARNAAVSARESRREALRQAKAAPSGPFMPPPKDMDETFTNAKVDTINKLLVGPTDRNDEAKIIGLLRGANSAELNHMISKLNMQDVIGDVDDRMIGPDHRTELLKLLSKDRLGDLNVVSRAAIVDAIQGYGACSDPAKKAVLDIFLGTHGAELTELKNRIDAGGDHRDLQELLKHDLGDSAIRSQILKHIANDAKGRPQSGNKVLSDVDDTFYVNWVDKSYPKKTVYPGVKQFYQELDRGAGPSAERSGDLGFLTARPWDPVGIFENQTHKMLQEKGVPDATVLTGDILHLLGNQNIANKKVDNFSEYKQQYPEYGYVFVGDSGQGDVMAAQKMLEMDKTQSVRGAFIHDVVNTPQAKRDEYRKQGVVFFDSYVGAAAEAFDKGLIHRDGMVRIAQSAISEFKAVKFDSEAQKQARLAEIQRDLVRVNSQLPADQQIKL